MFWERNQDMGPINQIVDRLTSSLADLFPLLGEKNPEFLKEKTHSFEYMKM